jgi:hypothetical protein
VLRAKVGKSSGTIFKLPVHAGSGAATTSAENPRNSHFERTGWGREETRMRYRKFAEEVRRRANEASEQNEKNVKEKEIGVGLARYGRQD